MILLRSSLPNFLKAYGTEDACLDAIFAIKWPHGFICPYCEHNDGYRLSRLRVMQCACCRRQTSITANTVFADSRVQLTSWFLALYLVANDKGGVSGLRLAEQLGVNRKTADRMLRKIRAVMGNRDKNVTLAGYIELDEAYLGGRKNTKSQLKSPFDGKVEVLVMVESENMAAGNLALTVIPDTKLETLKKAVGAKVDDDPGGQMFRADGLGRHHAVLMLGHHLNMNPMTKSELNTSMACLSLAISHLKRFFKGTYHHFCRRYVQDYLNEFCFRWNRRQFKTRRVDHLLTACVLNSSAEVDFGEHCPPLAAAA